MRSHSIAAAFTLLAVISAPGQITLNPQPTRVIGQTSLTVNNANPNLVEGREFVNPQGIALDFSVNPPALYVADTGNNRILGFRSAVGFSNGQKADVVIGQPDFFTTLAAGPGHTGRSTGLTSPVGIAVDASGNVYIADCGNNRVLRFPRPLSQSGEQIPDFVIGQPGFTTNGINQGGISAASLALSGTANPFQAYITFDSVGNLWVADAGNNRVLRFPASALSSQSAPGPSADVVLGQSDFITNTYAPIGNSALSLNAISTPTGIVLDSAGRLFVSESVSGIRGRILMFTPPFASGQRAARLLGVDLNAQQPPPVSEFQLNQASSNLFAVGNQIGIADTFNNRLLIFPPVEQWDGTSTFQPASTVVGQKDFNSASPNQGQPGAGPSTLSRPTSAVYSGSELYVADSLNQRIVVLPGDASGFAVATRVLGQDALDLNTANLIEGREFDFVGSNSIEAGLAVDLKSNPPHLYVADTFNNRILGFRDLRNLQPGQKADIVIGQVDFRHSWANYPGNDNTRPTQAGLFGPTGLYVDTEGNLYVADTGNGRVLRFRKPFDNYIPGVAQPADLVLGQISFFTKITDPSSRTMSAPYGIAQASSNGLLVSDTNLNRVLFFPGTTATFGSGQSATRVFGQPDFTSSASGSGLNRMNSPRHIATDSDDRLYVADSGNARVLIFDRTTLVSPDPTAAVALTAGLNRPRGLHVSPVNGELWVADGGNNTAIRFPAFNLLAATNYASNGSVNSNGPLAIAEDAWGNIFIADAINRVVIHYPALSALNAANYLNVNALAPGMIAALYSRGNAMQFGSATDAAKQVPLPRQLAGVQVLFNGAPVPLFFVSPEQINFQVPNGAPQSGTANLQVLEATTGRLLGDSNVAMTPVLPGFFTQAANGSGSAVAQNKDGTLNKQDNPAVAGDIITIYGTGQGFIEGAPADGDISGKALPTAIPPTVVIGGQVVTGSDITYAGLSPGLVGVWQINVKIPKETITLPNNPTQILAIQGSVPSGGGSVGRAVIIYVKQP